MRWVSWVICALAAVAFAPCVFAADLDDIDVLRGSEPVGLATFPRWSGFYFGGQFGYSDGNADFSNSTQGPIAYTLRNSALEATSDPSQISVLGTASDGAAAYGGFVGYNTQWQDVIVGIEANYSHTRLSLEASNSPVIRTGLSDGGGNTYTVGISGSGTLRNLDYGTLRARGGWILGNFLPYGFIGFALGATDLNVAASVTGTCEAGSTPGCSPFSFVSTAGKNGALLYGGTVGGGVDVALTQNIFLRGEFEYTVFAPISDVLISIISARVGAGLKF